MYSELFINTKTQTSYKRKAFISARKQSEQIMGGVMVRFKTLQVLVILGQGGLLGLLDVLLDLLLPLEKKEFVRVGFKQQG